MVAIVPTLLVFSVLVPSKLWFAPNQPINIDVQVSGPATLVLTDFFSKPLETNGTADVEAAGTVNLKDRFPQLSTPGTYLLYVTAKGGTLTEFLGTPLVIGVRQDKRRGAPPGVMVTKVEPLRFAVMDTEHGQIIIAFYYDVAPNTVSSFLTLAEQGFFDGLTVHRIMPSFVIQGGDPRGDGTGGPGYQIDAEFSDRPHVQGVLSMARSGDPNESPGVMPRPEFADSAGSQFFICLDYENTQQLDGRYTAFGKVVDGMPAVEAMAKVPLADERSGRPTNPPVIRSVQIKPVVAGQNPYATLNVHEPAQAPAPAGN